MKIHPVLLAMKLMLILTLCALVQASAEGYAQNITLDKKQATLQSVLREIRKQSGYDFFYHAGLTGKNTRISVQVKDATIQEALNACLLGLPLTYTIENEIVVIKPKAPVSDRAAAVQSAVQQIDTLQGSVVDTTGAPLPGVSVTLQGTTIGTATDPDGTYLIEIPPAADRPEEMVLVFSYIGFKTLEVPADGRTVIDVVLEQDVSLLDEIVVVGYGTQKRSDITGSVASVPQDRLSNLPVTNIAQAIQGTTAGIQVTQTSSVPGSETTMQVRGVNSINASRSPFIVLDGVPFFGSTNDINPVDIESIEILKDASAVAIYGTRGSNGVILITTKRGTGAEGKPRINYNAYVGLEDISNMLTYMGPDQYVQKYADFLEANNIGQTSVLPNAAEIDNYNAGITTDWMDMATQTGNIQEHNLSVSGAGSNISYYVSGTHLNQRGVVKGYQYKRTSIRSNIDADITDYLKVGVSGFFTDNDQGGGRVSFLEATAMSPYSVPYDESGDYIIYPMAPEQLFLNPLIWLTVDRMDKGRNLTGTGYAEITPGFLEGLSYRLNASYVYNTGRNADYTGREANDQSGTANVGNSETTNWVLENILRYTRDFDKHHIDFTGLYSAQKVDYFNTWSTSRIFINDALSFYNLGSGVSQETNSEGDSYSLLSQMARINYSYDSRYLLTLTARRDGYSAFGANTDKYGIFPSFAVGWNIHNEAFMSGARKINQLKLRFSYGKTGNQAIGPNQTVTTASTVRYPFGGTAFTGVIYNNLGNPNLNWESTTSGNIALDFALFNNRINGTAEAYKSVTEDILVERSLPGMTGYENIWSNLGEMQNVGFELTLNTVNIDRRDFRWETSLNFSTYKNELLDLYGDKQDDVGNEWFIGQPLDVIFGYEKIGIWQEADADLIPGQDPVAKPGDIRFRDQNGDGIIDANDRVVIGQEDPKWTGGLTNTFWYKNLHLSIFLQTAQGGLKRNADLTYADEAGRRNLPAGFGYWTPENPDNYWPSLAAYHNYRGYHFAEDWSYVRIKDVRLSYTVPGQVLDRYGIGALTLYVAGRNLYTFTDWFGWDPEMDYVSRGAENFRTLNYPVVRSFSFGLNLTL